MNTENRDDEHIEKYACLRLIDALCRLLSRNNVEFDEYTTEIFDKFVSEMSTLDHVLMFHASDENAMACKEERTKSMFKFEDYLNGTCGSFKQAMARAIQLADMKNREKIKDAFPDVYERYMEWFNGKE